MKLFKKGKAKNQFMENHWFEFVRTKNDNTLFVVEIEKTQEPLFVAYAQLGGDAIFRINLAFYKYAFSVAIWE